MTSTLSTPVARRLDSKIAIVSGGAAHAAFGDADVLFNHAGTLIAKPFVDTTEDDWDWLMTWVLPAANSEAGELENESAKILNPPAVFDRFIKHGE